MRSERGKGEGEVDGPGRVDYVGEVGFQVRGYGVGKEERAGAEVGGNSGHGAAAGWWERREAIAEKSGVEAGGCRVGIWGADETVGTRDGGKDRKC